jgi:hypothetical protein
MRSAAMLLAVEPQVLLRLAPGAIKNQLDGGKAVTPGIAITHALDGRFHGCGRFAGGGNHCPIAAR